MATWFARQTANINAANVWNSAPDGSGSWLTWPAASGDVLLTNSYTITVNVSVNLGAAGEFRNDTTEGATAGGSFTGANGVTLTGNVYAGSTGTRCVLFNSANGTVVGNITGGTASNQSGVQMLGTATLVVTGSVTGSPNASGFGITHSSSGQLTITGNVTGGSGSSAYGVVISSSGGVSITGDVSGGTGANSQGLRAAATGNTTITGNVMGNVGPGIAQIAASSVTVSGYVQASTTTEGITNTAQGVIEIGETRSASNGRGAVTGAFRFASTTAAKAMPIIAGSQKTLSVLDVAALVPAEADVEAGVVYGDGAYTGTLSGGGGSKKISMVRRI